MHFTDFCLHSFRGHRLHYNIYRIQLPAISWMPFLSDLPRYALCTLPFHIISWHFHPSTGNVSNFVLTHQSRYSRLSFLNLWSQRTFENECNTKPALSLLLKKRDSSNSPEALCGRRNPTIRQWWWSSSSKFPSPKSKPAKITENYAAFGERHPLKQQWSLFII